MSNIISKLLTDETILFQTKKNRVIFLFPILWLAFCVYVTPTLIANQILYKLAWVPWMVGIVFLISVWITYVSSSFIVTNKRVIMREGFFNRHVTEMRLLSISQVNVDQPLLGQLLGYGTVSINAFGASDAFTMIAKPLMFQQYVNEQLDKVAAR